MEKEEFVHKAIALIFAAIGSMLFLIFLMASLDFFSAISVGDYHMLLDKVLFLLILAEVFHITVDHSVEGHIQPWDLILVILTALGREMIVRDPFKQDPAKTLATGAVILFCIYGLKVIPRDL